MTPRALLTAIGATAIAFAVIIGAAAGSTGGATPATIASMTASGEQTRSLLAAERSGTVLAAPAAADAANWMRVEVDDCAVAV